MQTVQQQGPPKISLKKRQYTIDEQLLANCTTYKSRPAPHITWLINGVKVKTTQTDVVSRINDTRTLFI